jgi:hypothetical protein
MAPPGGSMVALAHLKIIILRCTGVLAKNSDTLVLDELYQGPGNRVAH